MIDLKTDGYPHFQYHHSIKIHESSVSACGYCIEPNRSIFQHLIETQKQETLAQQSQQQHQNQVGNATVSTPFLSNLVNLLYFLVIIDIVIDILYKNLALSHKWRS